MATPRVQLCSLGPPDLLFGAVTMKPWIVEFSQGYLERSFASGGGGFGRLPLRFSYVLKSVLGLDLGSKSSPTLRGKRQDRLELKGPRGLVATVSKPKFPSGSLSGSADVLIPLRPGGDLTEFAVFFGIR